jgi:hypothetical protein
MNIDNVLASATVNKSAKGKSKALEIPVSDVALVKKINTWLDSNKQVTLHEAKMEVSKVDILDFAIKSHATHAVESSTVPATVNLVTPNGSLSIDLAKNQYGKIPSTNEEDLKKIFGDDFEKCFKHKLSVKLTEAALNDKDILTVLIKAVGVPNFKKYFEVENNLVPTEVMHEGRFLDPKVKKMFTEAKDAKLVTPFSPSFKG